VALELLCIDAEAEWEGIFAGKVPNEGITERRARLARIQLEAEHKHFPERIAPNLKLVELANREANDYFSVIYGEGSNRD
jgi:hypothetical protein